MKCHKCGAELPEGRLYCEKCGEEVHIVPDFEPEIENSMQESLTAIAEHAEFGPETEQEKKHQRLFRIVSIAAGVLIVFLVLLLCYFHFRSRSLTYQLKRAQACYQNGKLPEAAEHYKAAIAMDETDISLQHALADIYLALGEEESYLEILNRIRKSVYASPDEVISAYKKLVAYYKEKEDYSTINTLVTSSDNDEVKNLFRNYMAQPPEFSYKGGNYAQVIPLKLTSGTQGTIYYTLDGMMPNENSEIYTTPIFLDTGNYTVTAIFVNEYGIKSDVVSQNFDIDVIKPPAPEVSVYSGEYTAPVMVEVAESMEGMVYYTTDGTEPTLQSLIYTGPIPMPLGKSVFHFAIATEDGVFGESTVREYTLTLPTEFTPEDALSGLYSHFTENGKTVEADGSILSPDLNGRYLYTFQYALSIPDEGDFYVISEVFEDSAGMQTKTGTVFAVNIYTGEYYKLSRGALDNYILEPY